jgi:hypothetical protein
VARWFSFRYKIFCEQMFTLPQNLFWNSTSTFFGEQIHRTYPNEVIHYDFVKIFNFYVLIIRDDLSGFTLLFFCETADSYTVAIYCNGL